jgi:hypothetical protein
MSELIKDRLERVEKLIELAQNTNRPDWAAAHALTALALIGKEWAYGR